MKSILNLLIIICCSSSLFGQLKMGLKVSYSKTSFTQQSNELLDLSTSSLHNLDYMSSENCTSYGLSLYADHGNMFFITDLMFRKCMHHFKLNTRTKSTNSSGQYDESYAAFHVPVTGGISFKSLRIGAGPIFNFGLDNKNQLKDMTGFSVRNRKLSTGFQFMLGVRLTKFIQLDLKREIAFNNVADNYYFLDRPIKVMSNPHMTTLSLGFYL